MKNKEDQKKQEALKAQAAADQARFDEKLAVAAKPTPVQSFLDDENLRFLEATSGKPGTPPLDVGNLPGMAPYMNLYGPASEKQDAERMGTGLLQMGEYGSNPEYASRLKELGADRRERDRGGALERLFAAKNAEVRGSILPLISADLSRSLGVSGQAGSQVGQSAQNYAQFQPRPSFFSNLLQGGLNAGLGLATGGLSSLSRPSAFLPTSNARMPNYGAIPGVR